MDAPRVSVSRVNDYTLTVAEPSADLAVRMRGLLPFLQPRPLGLQTSAGCGDRLGLATPGHIQGLRATYGDGPDDAVRIAPIFAQQSIRENARTGRTPQEVLDDAMWGVFQEGWREGYGADADHLKNFEDVDVCARAGYTFYTVDPGEFVDDRANTASPGGSAGDGGRAAVGRRWRTRSRSCCTRLTGKAIDLGDFQVELEPAEVMRAASKYGHAVAHTLRMYRHLASVAGDFEFEMSVDETETVTTPAEHIYIASELQRLGVDCISLAPRYVGTFEKGVDYIGDIDAFESSFRQHHAIACAYGPYKLSLAFRVGQVSRLPGCACRSRRPSPLEDGGHELSGGAARHRRHRSGALSRHRDTSHASAIRRTAPRITSQRSCRRWPTSRRCRTSNWPNCWTTSTPRGAACDVRFRSERCGVARAILRGAARQRDRL